MYRVASAKDVFSVYIRVLRARQIAHLFFLVSLPLSLGQYLQALERIAEASLELPIKKSALFAS